MPTPHPWRPRAPSRHALATAVLAVLAPLQHWATAIGVRADDASITRPRDLGGRTYARSGVAEVPLLRAVRADGGAGDLTSVTLTGAPAGRAGIT